MRDECDFWLPECSHSICPLRAFLVRSSESVSCTNTAALAWGWYVLLLCCDDWVQRVADRITYGGCLVTAHSRNVTSRRGLWVVLNPDFKHLWLLREEWLADETTQGISRKGRGPFLKQQVSGRPAAWHSCSWSHGRVSIFPTICWIRESGR